MYTHTITERNFYNIYYIIYIYIYIFTNFNFVIYGISIEIVIFCNYTHINLKNFFCTYQYVVECVGVEQMAVVHQVPQVIGDLQILQDERFVVG